MNKIVFVPALLAAALSTSVLADTYKLDPDHTNARFAIGHFGTSTNHGGFYNIEGELQLDAAKGTGQLKIEIPTDSVQTGNAAFDGHMKSADLLNVEKYPANIRQQETVREMLNRLSDNSSPAGKKNEKKSR